MKNVTQYKPLLLVAGLMAFASCGSTPESEPEPPTELLAESEPSPEVEALEAQLAEMAEALDVATAEPIEEEPPTAASEVSELYLDPSEAFPVEIVDGVPVQTVMAVEEEGAEVTQPEPAAGEEAVEGAVADNLEEPDAEALAPTNAEYAEGMESVEVVEYAEGMESVDEDLVDEASTEVEVAEAEPVEITEEDLAAMAEAMPDALFEDPGFIEPEIEPAEESVAELEGAEPEDGTPVLGEDAVAEAPEGDVDAVESSEPALEGEAVAMAQAPEATSEEAEENPAQEDAEEGLAQEEAEEGLDQVAEVEADDAPAPTLTQDEIQAAIAESIASAMEGAAHGQASPEAAAEEVLDGSSAVALAEEPAEVAGPEAIEWHTQEEVVLVADSQEPSISEAPADSADGADAMEGTDSADGEDAVTTAAAESLEIETIEEAPAVTAMNADAANRLPEVFAFTQDLDPRARLILGPLCLADPSGSLARTSMGVLDIAGVFTDLAAGPPEDPALAGLVHSDGSEFDPVPIEEAELTDEPGLGMIWWGDEVPEKQVASKLEVQTPKVGRVRLVLNSGDYVEGVLHSVGQSQYWIDGDLGRFAVRSGLVSHVEHLPKPGLGQEIAGLQAGDLVRAKAKNGFIEGRLISMKDGEALVETASGMRITLPNAEVEPLGESKTRVVID